MLFYCLQEESHGHAKALGKKEMLTAQLIDKRRKIFKQDVTLFERLGHLRINEGWD